MAILLNSHSLVSLTTLMIISWYFAAAAGGVISEQSHINLPSDHLPTEKITRLHFYYHEIRNDKNPSVVQIIDAPENVPNGFGATFVMDNAMTEGPEMRSNHVGRAQGIFSMASLQDYGEALFTNFVFTKGVYAGSTLTMIGRNPIAEQNREMAIVGGTGAFRFARGYVIANSVNSISTYGHYVVEYNVTVYHP